jgi:L-arabinokinase
VRVAAFMGQRMVSELLADDTTGGWLANLDAGRFEAELAPALPEALSGEAFLTRYGGTADPITTVDPDRTYAVRRCAAHPVHEQARVLRFAELLPRAADPAVAEELGALMLASHASYSACGLGSDATDRLVKLVQEVGPAGGLYGAKITGGGSGGTVAVLAREDAVPAALDVARRYGSEVRREPAVFRASSPGMAALGVLRVARDGAPRG